ncbi:MAG: trans-sulfuration enzyme family protein [Candidatus Cryptobacteroides sp.]
MKNSTKAIHSPAPIADAYGALSVPVYHTAAYEFANAEIMSDAFCSRVPLPDYSRITNPTVINLEDRICHITGASKVHALSSGMAAISNTMLSLASQGSNIVGSKHFFGNTYLLISKTLARYGIEGRFVDTTNLQEVEKAVDENTCCIFTEIISNPQQEVVDLRALSQLAHSKGLPLVADTTMIPFTHFSARELGVDIELVSSTKYLSGGATCIGGLVIEYGSMPEFEASMQEMLLNLGSYMSAHNAYMQTLGLENMAARYALESANTMELARRLRKLPQIVELTYIGLEDNTFHALAKDLFNDTYGAMITLELKDRQACFDFLNRLKLVKRATNLFDNRSLAIHPASTIFGNFSPEQRRSLDVSEGCIRLSVGLEDVDDIFEDLAQALEGC